MEKSIEKQLERISRGTVEIIQHGELKKKLERAIKENKPLVVKAGFDPTAPDIHLGHTVLLRKMRHFQDLGHKVVFLIGDATALVGDPSGQSQSRKVMTWDEVEKNARTYEMQVGKILDTKNSKFFERRHNSDWFSRGGAKEKNIQHFTFEEMVVLTRNYTVARLLERDDFEKRYKENKPISMLEFFYPLMQGYDSVMLKADVEIGGSDQKFNMLVGRDLQPVYGQEAQIVITMPILEGLYGGDKMSKSLNNYVGINEPAGEMYGKIMKISDPLMYKYYELLTDEDVAKIKSDVASGKLHPKAAKMNLAKIIVAQYHSKTEADKQAEEFDNKYRDKQFPIISVIEYFGKDKTVSVVELLTNGARLLNSRSEAKRKIQEGAVEINEKKVTDINLQVNSEGEYKIRVGKKFAHLLVRQSQK